MYAQLMSGSAERQITRFRRDAAPLILNYAWSRDGRLAVSRGNRTSDVVLISAK